MGQHEPVCGQQAEHFVAVFVEVFGARVNLKLGLRPVVTLVFNTATSMLVDCFRSSSVCHGCGESILPGASKTCHMQCLDRV